MAKYKATYTFSLLLPGKNTPSMYKLNLAKRKYPFYCVISLYNNVLLLCESDWLALGGSLSMVFLS